MAQFCAVLCIYRASKQYIEFNTPISLSNTSITIVGGFTAISFTSPHKIRSLNISIWSQVGLLVSQITRVSATRCVKITRPKASIKGSRQSLIRDFLLNLYLKISSFHVRNKAIVKRSYNHGQKKNRHISNFLGIHSYVPSPPRVLVESPVWESLRYFQLCKGGGRGNRPSVPTTILSGVVGDAVLCNFRSMTDWLKHQINWG